ncbi:hypothetical protein [Mesomycoplasma neurolyticum]|nr:hypothetical protein [Mesomycoplasma neurolyticum]
MDSAICKFTSLVLSSINEPGSLKAIWPFVPMPRIIKSIPPLSLINLS